MRNNDGDDIRIDSKHEITNIMTALGSTLTWPQGLVSS